MSGDCLKLPNPKHTAATTTKVYHKYFPETSTQEMFWASRMVGCHGISMVLKHRGLKKKSMWVGAALSPRKLFCSRSRGYAQSDTLVSRSGHRTPHASPGQCQGHTSCTGACKHCLDRNRDRQSDNWRRRLARGKQGCVVIIPDHFLQPGEVPQPPRPLRRGPAKHVALRTPRGGVCSP